MACGPLTYYFIEEVNAARRSMWNLPQPDVFGYAMNYRQDVEITTQAGVVMFIISSFMIAQLIINLVKVKTNTTRTLSIIGLSLIGLAFCWNLMMLSTPTHISFDEGGQLWLIAGMMMLAFSITFLVQVNRLAGDPNDEILDEEII